VCEIETKVCNIAHYANKLIFKIFWGCHFFRENPLGPLEKLLVGLQGSTRARWKGLSKTNIFMWFWCSLLCAISNTVYNSLTRARTNNVYFRPVSHDCCFIEFPWLERVLCWIGLNVSYLLFFQLNWSSTSYRVFIFIHT